MAFLLKPGTGRPVVIPPPPEFPPPDLIDYTVTLSQAGVDVPLTGVYRLQHGVEGFDEPDSNALSMPTAGVYGSSATGMEIPARVVVLDVLIDAPTATAWRDARARLLSVCNAHRTPSDPASGSTRITVTTKYGTRYIDGRRFVSSPITWDRGSFLVTGKQFVRLEFWCDEPAWVDPSGIDPILWVAPAGRGFLGAAFLPVTLGASHVFGQERAFANPGDLQSRLDWQVAGAGTSITVTHVQTGRRWVLSLTGVTKPVTVSTRRGRTSVIDATGANRWTKLAAPFDLWPLPPGDNTVRVDVTAPDATTAVIATGQSLHLTALT